MLQQCSGQSFDWCWLLKYYWVLSPRKATLPLHLPMQTSLRMRRSTLKFQEDLNSYLIMDVVNFWNWKRRSMVSVVFHVPSVNNLQISWSKLVWRSQSSIPAFLSVRKSPVLNTLMILYFGIGKKTTSITWQHLCEIWVLIWNKKTTLQAYW